ncbi:MAG TPA: VanW family protein [Miltoncostaeaceae bacterium]|nr:VanW family protein [Miltoncostaeaceae bacterium]
MPLPRPRRPETLIVVVALAVVVLTVLTVLAVRVFHGPDDRVPAGVSIGGIPVGGLTAEEAERVVAARAEPPPREVEIVLPGEPGFPLRVPVAELAPTPRARLAALSAVEQPSVTDRLLSEIGVRERTRNLPLRYRPDPSALDGRVAAIAARVDRPAVDAQVVVRSSKLEIAAAADGRAVDQAELRRRLARLPRRVEVPITVVPPAVADAPARLAYARAAALADRPVAVRGAGRAALIRRPALLEALRFQEENGQIAVSLDRNAIVAAVEPAFAGIVRPAASATFAVSGTRVSVVPSQEGRRLDGEAIARRIEARPAAKAVRVALVPLPPDRSTVDAQRMRIRELVSQFTTPHACCEPRVTNLQRAASILDGQIIRAGATFSLNTALGERTRSRGFVSAPQIGEGGVLEDAVGGGVSQTATTTFNAAFFAGLKIVTHTPHAFWITRYPPGREATVSWGGPELIVQNDWPAAILVKAYDTGTSFTVQMYSAKLGRSVGTETLGDPVEGTAFSVEYTRVVRERNKVKRDERFSWSYEAPPG